MTYKIVCIAGLGNICKGGNNNGGLKAKKVTTTCDRFFNLSKTPQTGALIIKYSLLVARLCALHGCARYCTHCCNWLLMRARRLGSLLQFRSLHLCSLAAVRGSLMCALLCSRWPLPPPLSSGSEQTPGNRFRSIKCSGRVC